MYFLNFCYKDHLNAKHEMQLGEACGGVCVGGGGGERSLLVHGTVVPVPICLVSRVHKQGCATPIGLGRDEYFLPSHFLEMLSYCNFTNLSVYFYFRYFRCICFIPKISIHRTNTNTHNPIGNCFSVPKISFHQTWPFALIPNIWSTENFCN